MNDSATGAQEEAPSMFSQLVVMIATSALQQLGLMPNPGGEEPEVQLEGAQGMIDILEMLGEKTKGNLDPAEDKMLKDTLTMLRLHFVEVKKATQSTGSQPASDAPAPEEEPKIETPPAKNEPEESKTRYRKSYG